MSHTSLGCFSISGNPLLQTWARISVITDTYFSYSVETSRVLTYYTKFEFQIWGQPHDSLGKSAHAKPDDLS